MGHNTLGVIPATRTWRVVVNLLRSSAATEDVIAASANAAEKDLLRATDDPVFVEAVRLLLCIPLAARSDDFGDALRKVGIGVQDSPELFDVISGAIERLDDVARHSRSRSDLGELAARALNATLTRVVGDALPTLFGTSPADLQATVRTMSRSNNIAVLMRSFFGSLVSQSLSYWLDRTLATQVGPGLRFATSAERHVFDNNLDGFTGEASRIIKEFSGGWYGKTLHVRGGFDSHAAAEFGAVALKKIVQELRRRNDRDA